MVEAAVAAVAVQDALAAILGLVLVVAVEVGFTPLVTRLFHQIPA
jgi:hypothetical protein